MKRACGTPGRGLRGKAVFLVLCTSLLVVLTASPLGAFAASEHTHDGKTFVPWTDAGSLPTEYGDYYLTTDVTIHESWAPEKSIYLCLNGHTITYAGSEAAPVIVVPGAKTMEIYECQDNPGSITGGTAGGVRVNSGTFYMYGGRITGNTGGPGVYIDGSASSLFTLCDFENCEVSGNSNPGGNGGGIYVAHNAMVACGSNSGFTVSGNTAANGAGIYCDEGGGLLASRFTITGNHATECGGGIYFASGSAATSSSSTISSNTADSLGGGIYLNSGSTATALGVGLTVISDTIAGNQALEGAGIYFRSGALNIKDNPVIDNNKAEGEQSNVYIKRGNTIGFQGSVTSGAKVGITMEEPGTFTTDYSLYTSADPASYFISDLSGYAVQFNDGSTEAVLAAGNYFAVRIGDIEHGTVVASKYSVEPGDTVELTATPEDGYTLDHFEVTGSGGDVSLSSTGFTMPAYDVTVTAIFSRDGFVEVESVSVDPTEITLKIGTGADLTATVLPEDATDKRVTWSSSDTEVATVSSTGRVTAVEEGTATITATTRDGGFTAECQVTVRPMTYTVTFTDGFGTILKTEEVERGSAATAPEDPTRTGYTFMGWDKDFSTITSDLTVNAVWKSDSAIEYIDAQDNPLYQNDYTVVSTSTTTMTTGWYVVRGEVNFGNSGTRINVSGNVNLILCDGAEYNVPGGFQVSKGNSFTIWCQSGKTGFLSCGGANGSQAGIGGSYDNAAGTITINGGVISATGGHDAAGIGSDGTDVEENLFTFTMNGGTVTARGGQRGAGIGGGCRSHGGTVTITGGTLYAYGGATQNGATKTGGDGIGAGSDGYNVRATTITGGTVYAEGKDGGAGIGSTISVHVHGPFSVTITGGDVTAIGSGGAGIGGKKYSGWENGGGKVTITGGAVTAISASYETITSAAIGKGFSDDGAAGATHGTLTLGPDRRVKAGSNESSMAYVATDDRVTSIQGNRCAHIDACEHENKSYTITPETHTWHCDNCAWTEDPEAHIYDDDGVCTACGARVYLISFDANGGSGSMATVQVVAGEPYTLPACGFEAPAGKAFTGWDYTGGSNKPVGTTITPTGHMTITAHWDDMTWARLQTYINSAVPGSTITLYQDLTATSSDSELTIPEGANLTIDLNGHTLNRNLSSSSAKDNGSVFHIHPSSFTLKNGTITGGNAKNGGGIRVDESFSTSSSGRSFTLIDVNVTSNKASGNGGGVYTMARGSITGGSIANNTASGNGGGVYATQDNWELYIGGTSINGNRAGKAGGGIYAGKAVSLTNSTVTSNSCGGERTGYGIYPGGIQYQRDDIVFEGGGVFVWHYNSLYVGGKVIINNNVSTAGGSHANNAYVRDNGERRNNYDTIQPTINCGSLTEDSIIGITYEIKEPAPDPMTTFPVRVTRNLSGNGDLSNFFADESNYSVALDSTGDVILGRTSGSYGLTVTLKPGTGQGSAITQKIVHSSQYTLPGKPGSFTAPNGTVFTGWKAEGNETYYRDGQSIPKVESDITFVAQWGSLWQSLQDEIDRASSGATIKLDRDYTAVAGDRTLVIPNGKTITIDLNGHTLDGNHRISSVNSVFNVGTSDGSGATLTIKDTSSDKNGTITGGAAGIQVYSNSTATLSSGTIAGNELYGVYIPRELQPSGTFTMNGGAITDNGYCGVSCTGTFTMTGGEISGHQTGVYLTKGTEGVDPAAVMNVSGTPVITGNGSDSGARNVVLSEGVVINVTSNLKNGAAIGVTSETALTNAQPEVPVTSGLSGTSLSIFTSDDPVREIIKSSGEAALTLPAASATVTAATGLVYNGQPQVLATASNVVGGTVVYALSEDGPFSETLTATDAGRYWYYFKVVGDDNHRDSAVTGPKAVSIARATPDIGDVTADEVIGSLDAADAVLHRSDETIPGTLTLDETTLTEGTHAYHWTFTPDDTDNYAVAVGTVEITARDREWQAPTYEWADDNSTVTATRVAVDDPAITQTETARVTSEVTKDPTCMVKGETTYTATFQNAAFSTQTKTLADIDIDPDAHKWGEWEVTKPATEVEEGEETRVCEHNEEHKETRVIPKPDHVHVLTHVEAEEATCTEDGNIEYWVCDKGDYPCGRFFEDEEATPESEIDQADTVIAATGHTPKDPVQENIAEPTCEHAGSYDEVVYCNVCGAELSRVTIETPTKPHEYGDAVYTWSGDNGKATATRTCGECGDEESETVDTVAQVTKEPTATERGETTYTAVFTKDGFTTQTKTVADIEPLTYRVTSGDGQTWTKGSGASASFTFKRSYKDALAFGKFTGILVDGESVAESDYTAQSGSVIVELAPAYLETLAKGGHTLAATFEDGSADASFTVVEKESGGSGGDQGDGSGGSGLPFSGDRSPLPLCALLMLLAGVVAVSWALRKEHAA